MTEKRPSLDARMSQAAQRVAYRAGRFLGYHTSGVSSIIGVVGIVIALAGAMAAFLGGKGHDDGITFDYSYDRSELDLKEEIIELHRQNDAIKTIQARLSSLSTLPKDIAISTMFAGLEQTVNNLDEREKKLEAVILQDPSKALAIPLLRKDIDNARVSEQSELAATKGDIDRVYDLFKWICGSTVLVGLGSVFSNLFGKKAGEQGAESE